MEFVTAETVDVVQFFLGKDFFKRFFEKTPNEQEDEAILQVYYDQQRNLETRLSSLRAVWWCPTTAPIFQAAYDLLKNQYRLETFDLFGEESLRALTLMTLVKQADEQTRVFCG